MSDFSPGWIHDAQKLSGMMAQLRKAEHEVEMVKGSIRRFLRACGCSAVPWGPTRSDENQRNAPMDIPDERIEHEPAVQALLDHEHIIAGIDVAAVRNGNGHQYAGDHPYRNGAEVLHHDGKQLAR